MPNVFLPQQAVCGLLVSWLVWLALVSACIFTLTPPVVPEVVVATSMVPLLLFVSLMLYYQDLGDETSEKGSRLYSYNLANTIITVVAAVVGLPVLYSVAWYPDRVRNLIEYSEDTVDNVRFPAVVLFQRTDWASQAILSTDVRGDCFIGWSDPDAPACNDTTTSSPACRCEGSWADEITDFQWHGTTYRVLALESPLTRSPMPTTQMITQTPFYYNSSGLTESTFIPTPTLWIAVYDPALTLGEAMESGYTRMYLLNANGMTAISLTLHYREVLGKSPAYDYGVSFSTVPASKVGCDLASDPKAEPCILNLFLQYPTFDRQVSRQSVALTAGGLVTEAGAWFALFQLVGWLFSGLAIQPK
ncbi:hypothetical protein B0T14DRAFT_209641 [Immersiella caudata]|uniref:Uncharacterized protein n=1 Tax=Immersiella caudata TaxID=314043 RepID=A0AA39WQ46_9PEZI|nr:hypothetical protein B0T14DRAFT_209641 [Immersiella caudata]